METIDYNSLSPEQKKDFIKNEIARKRNQFTRPQGLPTEVQKKLSELACRLSPENLHEDGEITPSQARQKHNQIMKELRQLEKETGLQLGKILETMY